MEYDVIGDVHGQGAKLRALLAKLGYRIKDGAYRHPQGRMAVFLGDLIDRGPEQRETLDIVRRMTDAGTGRSILGNHELNAIGYATPDPRPGAPGASLRRHSEKNQKQHAEFLRQIGENSPEHREWVGWFRTLPPSLDLGGIRVVHAWWDDELVQWVEARRSPERASRAATSSPRCCASRLRTAASRRRTARWSAGWRAR